MKDNEQMDAPVTFSVFNAFRAEVLERFEADRKEREADRKEREADRKEREAEMQEIKNNFAMIFELLDTDKKERETEKKEREAERNELENHRNQREEGEAKQHAKLD